MKEVYEYVAVLEYADDGINIRFPDLPECISCANNTEEAIKNAEEVLGLILYAKEEEKEDIPEPTPLRNIVCNKHEKTVLVRVWMPLVRSEMKEQSVKKTLTIPRWLNERAEKENINFSKILQAALKEYLNIKQK